MLGGILPVIHHHRCRGGGTTSVALVGGATICEFALVPVRVGLIPQAGEQWAIGGSGLDAWSLHGSGLIHFCLGVSEQPVELTLVAVEPHLHVAGDAVKVERAVAIGEDFLGTVVARDDDKRRLGVENVIHWALSLLAHLGLDELGIGGPWRHHLAGIYLTGKILLRLGLSR